MKNIGSTITALRTERGVSLSSLARDSGIAKSLLHRIENQNDANPELSTLKKIADALDVTVGDLLQNEVVKNARQMPAEMPGWLDILSRNLRKMGREPDKDLLEALYVIQNRKGKDAVTDEDWIYSYHTLERSFRSRVPTPSSQDAIVAQSAS